MYLLSFSIKAQELCFEFIESGEVDIYTGNIHQVQRIHQLMKKYYDLPMDLADASILVLAEEKRITTIFTLDHRDFRVYVPTHTPSFFLIPERL
ncbi:MAG: hypothetical protein ABIF11_03730 [Nitrospirota bacterium]